MSDFGDMCLFQSLIKVYTRRIKTILHEVLQEKITET